MKKVSLIMAMEGEARGLIAALALKPHKVVGPLAKTPMLFYRGSTGSLELTLTIPGPDPRYKMDSIGTEAASVAAISTICEFKPDLLISAGTAGGFASKGACVAEVFLSESEFFYHDRRILIAGWDEMSRGRYPSLDVRAFAKSLGLKTANVSSGNSLDFTQAELTRIHESGASIKEMEAAGIAWVAMITQTPFFAVKSVTNLIDENPDTPSEFSRNFDAAVLSLTSSMLNVLKTLPQSGLI